MIPTFSDCIQDNMSLELRKEQGRLILEIRTFPKDEFIAQFNMKYDDIIYLENFLKTFRENSIDSNSLLKENEHLKDILVSITHHAGALEEQRSRWEPIVKEKLKRTLES